MQFALYTAESTETCAGYPASLGRETLDADTFASWGVDYLKVRMLVYAFGHVGSGHLKTLWNGFSECLVAIAKEDLKRKALCRNF